MQTVKSNAFLHYQKTIYLERYSADTSTEIICRRKRMAELQSELKDLRIQLQQITTKQHYPDSPINMLQETVNIMHMHSKHIENPQLFESMQQHIISVKREIVELEQRISALEREKSGLFRDATKNEYHLFGVIVHEGEASFGHYWLLLFDAPNKRWLKYNDSLVTVVPEEQVFADTTGKTFNAQSLIYVESDKLESLTSVLVRSSHYRAKYPMQQ
jgi:polyhydroxyalkanoate synthesis regulator phasin